MAVKDHSLDGKIVQAAKKEFMEKGYQKASLHEIARRAGLTTGALYTRYKNKDALFRSLIQEVFEAAEGYDRDFYGQYHEVRSSGDPTEFLETIRREEQVYRKMLIEHYDACVLLLCRSSGSSAETELKQMMDLKIRGTVEYFKSISRTDLDLEGVGLLMSEQFHFFRQILERGYSTEQAVRCMQTIAIYQEAGWKALFEAIF